MNPSRQALWMRKDRKLNPEKYKQRDKKRAPIKRAKFYGLTVQQIKEMEILQNGVCAICGEPSTRTLQVDHDHKTGKIRNLLCFSCNAMLGNAKDNPELLKRGIIYLEAHSSLANLSKSDNLK